MLRGSSHNPPNRFERLVYEPDPGEEPEGRETQVFIDSSKSLITENDSPDVGMERGINPYRGCGHGCSYCYARPYHEFLGLSAGLDFETRIFAKPDAPALLRRELGRPSYAPATIAMSGATDPYQPVERKLRIARGCLEVFRDTRHPVCVITKSAMVERDIDLLADLARDSAAAVVMSLTTLDPQVQRAMEPQASTPRARLEAIRRLADAGIPVRANLAPVVPGLTDHEMPALLAAAKEAGASHAVWILLRLPHGVKELFDAWLHANFPLKRDKVLNALRDMHGGELYNPQFGTRMRGEGPRAEQIARLFQIHCQRLGLSREPIALSAEAFRRPPSAQQDLFGG